MSALLVIALIFFIVAEMVNQRPSKKNKQGGDENIMSPLAMWYALELDEKDDI